MSDRSRARGTTSIRLQDVERETAVAASGLPRADCVRLAHDWTCPKLGAEAERGLAPQRSGGACPPSAAAARAIPENGDRPPAASPIRERPGPTGPGASPHSPPACATQPRTALGRVPLI